MKNLSICRRYKILPKRWLQCSVAIALALAFFGIPTTGFSPVQALGTNLLTVRGTSTATTSAGTSIAIGDVFNWVATFDLDTPSTGSTPSYGNKFNDSLTAFSLTKSSANTGTWNPSGINWPITPASNVDANANGNGITVQLRPTNAPAINSQAFFDVGVSFGWSSSDLDAVWVSGSTTLSTWLGTNSPNLNSAYLRLELRDNSYSSASFTSTLTSSTTTTSSSSSAGADKASLFQASMHAYLYIYHHLTCRRGTGNEAWDFSRLSTGDEARGVSRLGTGNERRSFSGRYWD